MVTLLLGWTVGLAVVALAVRTWGEEAALANPPPFLRRLWQSICHPARRGLPDPSWAQIDIGMIAIGALLISAASVAAPNQVNNGVSVPSPIGWVIDLGLGLASVGVVGLGGLAFVALMRRREDALTPFVISHDPKQKGSDLETLDGMRLMPVNLKLGDSTIQQQTIEEAFEWEQIRVRVKNKGSIGIQRVRAYLEILEGQGRDFFLHLQNDNEPLHHLSRNGEYLTTQQSTWFDVAVVHRKGSNQGFYFCYADEAIGNMSHQPLANAPMRWRVRITVSGWTDFRDVVPCSREFVVYLDGAHKISLGPAQAT